MFSKNKNKHWSQEESELLKKVVEQVDCNLYRQVRIVINGTMWLEKCFNCPNKKYFELGNIVDRDG